MKKYRGSMEIIKVLITINEKMRIADIREDLFIGAGGVIIMPFDIVETDSESVAKRMWDRERVRQFIVETEQELGILKGTLSGYNEEFIPNKIEVLERIVLSNTSVFVVTAHTYFAMKCVGGIREETILSDTAELYDVMKIAGISEVAQAESIIEKHYGTYTVPSDTLERLSEICKTIREESI